MSPRRTLGSSVQSRLLCNRAQHAQFLPETAPGCVLVALRGKIIFADVKTAPRGAVRLKPAPVGLRRLELLSGVINNLGPSIGRWLLQRTGSGQQGFQRVRQAFDLVQVAVDCAGAQRRFCSVSGGDLMYPRIISVAEDGLACALCDLKSEQVIVTKSASILDH